MKFIHIADIHLGASPETGSADTGKRAEELWDSLSAILDLCEEEQTDLLLIAGDLFHRQPLLRELKELNYLFSKLTVTKVVLIVGNHDYMKRESYYHSFKWSENVYPLLSHKMEAVVLEDLDTAVYGFSYHSREILENRYDEAKAEGKAKHEILLAHGGDEKHIPIQKNLLKGLGYDYIALGHIHKPQELVDQTIRYAGALEPIDKNDVGPHGYIRGEITESGVTTEFVPCAKREYLHLAIPVGGHMTSAELKEVVQQQLTEHGPENLYKFILTGHRDPDIIFDVPALEAIDHILEVVDETVPAYNFEELYRQNQGNILGAFIRSFSQATPGSVQSTALYEGVQAILETKE